jgi:hypothetical protein
MTRKLLEQALEAMQRGPWTLETRDKYAQTITAIREHLAKPKPTPVGWFFPDGHYGWQQIAEEYNGMKGSTPLYLHPEGEE